MEIANSDGKVCAGLHITRDLHGQLWLDDEPMTLMEARQLWSMIEPAIPTPDNNTRRGVSKALLEAGRMQAHRAGRRS